MNTSMRRQRRHYPAVLITAALLVLLVWATAAQAALAGASALLTRAPYLTDVSQTSVQVTWVTTTQSRGTVRYGPPGACTANTVSSVRLGNPITIGGVREYQNTVTVTGLSASTAYCYRVLTGGSQPVDLLGSNPAPVFTTLDPPAGSAPFTFVVFGDWGDTTNSGVNDGSLNVNQAGVDAQIAASGARFALSTGDIAYPGGTQTSYGDLNQTGVNVSSVFATRYWMAPGQTTPLFGVTGNHGRTATFTGIWPEPTVVAASGGTYGMVDYPSINGSRAAKYPTSYYAFSTGGVRFYILDASWSETNAGDATGGACGSPCKAYEVDYAAHWTATSAEYQWLAKDLTAHPGGLKMAVFHYPLRSDDSTEPNDAYLQNSAGSTGTLEQLLHDHGVNLVFNGHAHVYQRNVAPPGGVISYVTGGGGARVVAMGGHGCAATDAYAIGWSYANKKGSRCGAAAAPTSDAQVFHLLRVRVSGTAVTVTPVDSTGRVFDPMTYDFRADPVPPSAVGSLTAATTATSVVLRWSPASDNVRLSGYDIYRGGTYLATVPPGATGYTDVASGLRSQSGYEVRARDLAGNSTSVAVTSAP